MKRYDCMKILASKLNDQLVILSLGGSVDEWYNAAPHMRLSSLFQQQLGCVTTEAFGLSLGLPHRKIIALDTDGGLFFNLGILATLANEQPKNLFIIVWDNECYLSIGGPPTHTASGIVDLGAIAKGAGIEQSYTARNIQVFETLCDQGLQSDSLFLIIAKVEKLLEFGLQRKKSVGVEDKFQFVRHVEQTENITIIGPSEHN